MAIIVFRSTLSTTAPSWFAAEVLANDSGYWARPAKCSVGFRARRRGWATELLARLDSPSCVASRDLVGSPKVWLCHTNCAYRKLRLLPSPAVRGPMSHVKWALCILLISTVLLVLARQWIKEGNAELICHNLLVGGHYPLSRNKQVVSRSCRIVRWQERADSAASLHRFSSILILRLDPDQPIRKWSRILKPGRAMRP